MLKIVKSLSIKHFLYLMLLHLTFLPAQAQAQTPPSDCHFCSQVSWDRAVPRFINAVVDSVGTNLTEEELEEVRVWAEETSPRITEFLDDWLQISAKNLNYNNSNTLFTDVQQTNDKWVDVIMSYPGIETATALVRPLVEELLRDLPQISSSHGDIVPMQNVYEWYQEMEAHNPWGLASIFQILPLPDEIRQESLKKNFIEIVRNGKKEIYIVSKQIVIKKNSELTFFKVVENNKTVQEFTKLRDPTLIHEILRQAKTDPFVRPDVVEAITALAALVDEQLLLVVENDLMSQDLYDIIYENTAGPSVILADDPAPASPLQSVDGIELSEPGKLPVYGVMTMTRYEPNDAKRLAALDLPAQYNQYYKDDPYSFDAVLKDYSSSSDTNLPVWFLGIALPTAAIGAFKYFTLSIFP